MTGWRDDKLETVNQNCVSTSLELLHCHHRKERQQLFLSWPQVACHAHAGKAVTQPQRIYLHCTTVLQSALHCTALHCTGPYCMHAMTWSSLQLGLCFHDSRVEISLGWDLSCVYERWVGIKREEFNKPFPYYLYNFLKKDPAKYTTNLFNLFTCIFCFFATRVEISTRPLDPGWDSNPVWDFNSGCHVNAWLLLCACRVETRHVNNYIHVA